MNFTDNVAVITGAASGIGKAIAEKCIKEGMRVVLADIDLSKLQQCEFTLKKRKNAGIVSIVTDVSKECEVRKLAKETIAEFGKVNLIFNNAGIVGPLGPLWEQRTDSIENVLRVNLFGVIHGIKAFVPVMLAQNDQCYIINTSAGAGLLTGRGLSAYKASKHAITAISEVLDADLKQLSAKIQVSLLIPHFVNTDIPNSIQDADAGVINSHMAHLKNFGMSTSEAADIIFAGIKDKKFYIFTHPEEHLPKLKQRLDDILSCEQAD
jgi:NAD(P)-dependent dehydrogenase (short-subunit alcohol dehydrogenase family)